MTTDDHGVSGEVLLSNEELLVELARARKEAERLGCPDAHHASGERPHGEAVARACACVRLRDLEREVELRLAGRGAPARHVARAG